jgi:hypothetical protein
MKKSHLTQIVIPKQGNGVKLKVGKRLKLVNSKTLEKLVKALEKEGLDVKVV